MIIHRQSSIRNQRSKKTKVKHALQICFLLAVYFWLIYQVKHSHDKRREFDESDGEGSSGLIKLGRKDIHPHDEEILTKNERRDEEADDEEDMEEEIVRNKDEDETRDGDDEKGEHETENLNSEIDDDERENGVENETGGNGSNREAREELYTGDDASSAVTHVETTQNGDEIVRNSIEHFGNISKPEKKANKSEAMNNGEMAKDVDPSNVTDGVINLTGEKKNSFYGSPPNNTMIETRNSTTETTTQIVNGSLPELNQGQGVFTTSTSTKGFILRTIALELANDSTLGQNSTSVSKSNFKKFPSPPNKTDSPSLSVEITTSDIIDGIDEEALESPVTESVKNFTWSMLIYLIREFIGGDKCPSGS